MILVKARTARRLSAAILLAFSFVALGLHVAAGQTPPKKPVPAKPAAAPAKPSVAAPAKPGAGAAATAAGHPSTTTTTHTTTTGHGPTTTTTAHTTTSTAGAHPTVGGVGAHPATVGRLGGAGPAAHGGVPGVQHGNLAHAGPVGSHDRVGAHGEAVRMRANGRPSDIHTGGMDIHHNLGGGRRVEVERADHSRLYYERGRPGYVAHPYSFRGHDYYRRTYYYNGRAYDRFYNQYAFRGVALDVYAPVHYFGIGLYGWAYNPWAAPVPYAWGFAAAPWYGFYGGYFAPYPVYTAPSLWLTDYLISTSLESAYQARIAAQADADAAAASTAAAPAPPAPLTPEVKQMIADEVARQIALENAEAQANAQGQVTDPASSSIARILSDGKPHVFVAAKEIDLVDDTGQECAVTDGDVLQLKSPPAPDAVAASLVVLSSKGGIECRRPTTVSVIFEDLQDMQNHMRETVDQGLGELQAKQGQGGLPQAPQSAMAPPVTALVAQNAPPPDPAGAQEIAQQAQQSEKAEQDALAATAPAGAPAEVAAAPAPAGPPATISLGQSIDDVKAAMGQPTSIINLGPKTIYVYKDMKITFKAGKVSDVE